MWVAAMGKKNGAAGTAPVQGGREEMSDATGARRATGSTAVSNGPTGEESSRCHRSGLDTRSPLSLPRCTTGMTEALTRAPTVESVRPRLGVPLPSRSARDRVSHPGRPASASAPVPFESPRSVPIALYVHRYWYCTYTCRFVNTLFTAIGHRLLAVWNCWWPTCWEAPRMPATSGSSR
jgi:hypothetical protein